MKNQIDQSTPFLAFYDLLRIRGIYSDEEKREKLRRGFRRAMALAAVLVGLILPQGAGASVLGDLADENGVISTGSHRGLPGDILLESGDALKIGTDGKGNALFQTDNSWKTTGGSLSGGLVYLLAKGGITFDGGSFNVEGLVAAAIGKSEFRLGDKLVKSDVTGDISGSAGGNGFRVYVGKTVGASGGTIVATEGMSDGASFTISGSNGGTITFSGDVGSGTLKARTVNFDDGSSTSGSVTAEDGSVQVGDAVAGSRQDEDGNDVETLSFNQNAERSMTQNAGTISASTISGAIDQKAGTIDAGSATATLNVGAGSTLGAGNVTAGTVTVGSGSGALTLAGNTLSGKTINAGAVTLAGAENQAYNVSGNISSIQTGDNAAGDVTANKTGTGTLTLNSINANSLTLQSVATASGNISANTISATTLTQGSGTITTKEITGTVVQNDGIIQAVNAADGLKLNNTITIQHGTLDGNGGNVTVANGSTLSGTVSANTLNGNFTQSAGSTINATTVAGTVTQNGGTIQANNATDGLTLSQAITTQNGILSGNGGNVTVANGTTLSGTVNADTLNGNFTQSAGSTINATTVAGTVTQNGGTIQANNSTDGLTLSQAITTQNGTLSGNGGDITLAGGDTLSGIVSAKNLTAGTGNITQSAGTITVEETLTAGTFTQGGVAATTASAATIAANVEQTGGGTITATTAIGADGNAKTVAQSGTGLIKTDHVYGTVSQTGSGAARLQANAANGTLVLEGDVTQNNANATIGTTDTDVTVKNAAFKQQDNTKGKVEAHTLTLDNAAKDKVYDFYGEGNQIATITGTARSVGINNGEHNLTLKDLSTSADIAVTGAKDVTLDGVSSSSGEVRVLSATGKVSDTSAQGAVALELGRRDAGSDVRTVGSVNLVNGTGAITLQGVNAKGDVAIKNDSVTLATSGGGAESKGNIYADGDVGITTAALTQNGKGISGKNVTILGTGTLTTGTGKLTATGGDVLVKSATGKVTTGATEISALKNVVIQGTSVETAGTTIEAATTGDAGKAGIGINAMTGNVTIGANTKMVAQTVVLKADKGNVSIAKDGTVSMDSSQDTSGEKNATLVVFAGGADGNGGTFDADLGSNKPSKNVTIAKAATAPVNSGDIVDLDTFSYKTAKADGMTITFLGSNIALENTAGAVTVNTTEDITIINASGGSGSGSIAAVNVADSSDSPVTVAAGADAASSPAGLIGTSVTLNTATKKDGSDTEYEVKDENKNIAAGNVTVAEGAQLKATGAALEIATQDDKAIEVKEGAVVQSETDSVTLESGGALTVDGRVVSGTIDNDGNATPVGAVSLEAAGAMTVGKTGVIEGKTDVTVTSDEDKVDFYGTATSSEGNIKVSAATRDTDDTVGKTVTIGNGTDAATLTAIAGNVELAGGRGVQVASNASIAAGGTFNATAAESVSVAGTVQSVGKATLKTDEKQVLVEDATKRAGITIAGRVQSTEDAVQMDSAGSVDVLGSATVAAKKTLDVTANGESTDALKQGISLAGTVSSEGKATLKAEKGSIEQTGGSLSSAGLEMTAKDINQSGGSVTATGESLATASAGSVKLGQGGNDFDTLAVTAEQEVNVQDTDELAISIAGNTTGDVRLQAGAPAEGAGDVSLNVTTAITAGGAVTATAAGNATLEKDVQGASVTATATGGALETKAVTANNGNAALSGASVTTGGDVKANAANADVSITATDGANTTAGAVEAGRNTTINAGGGAAQVAVVTATAGNAAVIGGAGATVGGKLTAGGNAIVVSDGGAATVNADIEAPSVGLQGNTVENNATVVGANQLAIVQTGNQALELTDATIPTGVQTVGIQSAGDLTVDSAHDLVFGNASVTAGGRTVAANGLASTAGAVDVSSDGNIQSSAITGAAGTTVTTENGGTINVAGNLGQGGDTVVNANGAAVTAGTLASGDLLDVNNAGAVNANIAAGGDAQIQAASLQAGNTAAGGNLTFDTVTGPANVGNLAVGGDVNGTVNGLFTTAGGQVGSIGQQGGFNAPGGATVDGNLNSGPVLANTGAFTVNGALNAGGNAVVLNTAATTLNGGLTGGNVTINAGGPVTGGGALAAGQLNIAAGGNAITLPNVQSANLNNITGGNITLTDTTGQQITIGTINAGGVLDLTLNSAAGTAGGGNLTANGTMTLTVNGPFGTIAAPVVITINGGNPVLNIDGSGIDGSLLHFILNGALDPGDFVVNYLGEGFAIYGSQQAGWQIIGIGPEKQRLLNRALAFSVNTPELKSKQGIFGDPAMLHTRMNVSEARPGANMDMLALKSVDFSETWKDVSEAGGDLAEWTPAVFVDEAPLLPKLEALASEVQLQPEIQPYHGSTGNADAKE